MAEHGASNLPLPALPALHGVSARALDTINVLALRHLPGGQNALLVAVQSVGFDVLPPPGHFIGTDPWLMWRSATEYVLITTRAEPSQRVHAALAPGMNGLACTIEQSAGIWPLEFTGAGIDALFARLADAQSMPRHPGQGRSLRLVDIAVVMLRLAPERLLLLADRAHGPYLVHWLEHLARAGVET